MIEVLRGQVQESEGYRGREKGMVAKEQSGKQMKKGRFTLERSKEKFSLESFAQLGDKTIKE